MTPPPILGQDDLIECLRWAAFKMYGAGEHETFASDAITMAIYHIEDLRHDLERQMTIANEHVNEVERLLNLLRDCNTESISWLDARDAALEQSK